MKRYCMLFLSITFLIVGILCNASAELSPDYHGLSLDELNFLRDEKYHELELINQAIAEKR